MYADVGFSTAKSKIYLSTTTAAGAFKAVQLFPTISLFFRTFNNFFSISSIVNN